MSLELLKEGNQSFKQGLAAKTTKELKEYQVSLYKELNRLYVVFGLGKLKKTSVLSQVRRQIAVTHTLLGKRHDK